MSAPCGTVHLAVGKKGNNYDYLICILFWERNGVRRAREQKKKLEKGDYYLPTWNERFLSDLKQTCTEFSHLADKIQPRYPANTFASCLRGDQVPLGSSTKIERPLGSLGVGVGPRAVLALFDGVSCGFFIWKLFEKKSIGLKENCTPNS